MGVCRNKLLLFLSIAFVVWSNLGCRQPATGSASGAAAPEPGIQTFSVKGFVHRLDADGRTVVIEHEAISNYMAAMTMPFRASDTNELAALAPGDEILFRLQVSQTDSWIDRISKTGKHQELKMNANTSPPKEAASPNPDRHPLFAYKFTNELGQAVSLDQFDGQALA